MKGSHTKPQSSESGSSEAIDWELRPGGMLVQKREDDVDSSVPMIKIKVFHDSYQHQVTVPAKSTFGELKAVLAQETGLAPDEQRLLFRGKEKDDDECLHMAGVKDMSKVVLLQDPASRERKLEQLKHDQENSKACEAVAGVRDEVDKLVEKVNALKYSIHRGSKVKDQEFVVLTELLMRLLLKLDSIEADGEAKIQRKAEVRRIQHYVEMLDALKFRNSDHFRNSSSSTVATEWHKFDSGVGSLNAPAAKPFTEVINDWEKFE